MKFFLDENFPKRAIHLLIEHGHQAFQASDFLPRGATDHDIFQETQHLQSVLLTTDKDFFYDIPFLFEKHNGVVIIALTQPNGQKILNRLNWVLRWLQQGRIENKVLLVTDRGHFLSRSI